MKNLGAIIISFLMLIACNQENEVEQVITFKGQQVTGVTVTAEGRIFANFPRWRERVENSVVEINDEKRSSPYPNEKWNSWKLGNPIEENVFLAVQSVVAFDGVLYVLDTRNPLFQGVLDQPRIFAFDLNSNELISTYLLSENVYHHDSYINDLRVDKKKQKIYLTDSGHAGLVVLDLKTKKSIRILDNHYSTQSEVNRLNFENGVWENTVHSDGIAFDAKNDYLYFHALTGYSLYRLSTNEILDAENKVEFVAKTSAPDGMIIDESGGLYFADLEHNKIMKMDLQTKEKSVFAEGDKVRWADTFSIFDGYLYFTNSRINETSDDISIMSFSINKIKL